MDRATMQNLLLFGGAGGVPAALANQNNEASNIQDQQTAQAIAGYPALMRQYLQQQQLQQQQQQLQQQQLQQQQQQQQHQQQQQQQQQVAAQAAISNLTGLSGSAPVGALSNGGNNAAGIGGALAAAGTAGLLPQGLGQRAGAPDYMDANRMLLQRLQGGQQGNWIGDMSGDGDPYAENGILGPWSATSAGLLGKMAVNNQDKGKKVRRKPKDKPKRPLSAYNIFFKEERGRILEKIPDSEKNGGLTSDGKARKRKKRPHGKIGFENLAKVIGQRWQELTPEQVEYYKKKAEEDMKRYKDQMEVYLAKQDDGKKKKEVEGVKGDEGDGAEGPSTKKARTEHA